MMATQYHDRVARQLYEAERAIGRAKSLVAIDGDEGTRIDFEGALDRVRALLASVTKSYLASQQGTAWHRQERGRLEKAAKDLEANLPPGERETSPWEARLDDE